MVSKLKEEDDLLRNPITSDREPTPEQRKASQNKKSGDLTEAQKFSMFYYFLIEQALGGKDSFSLSNPYITDPVKALHASLLLDEEYAEKGGVTFEGKNRVFASRAGETYGDVDFSGFDYSTFSRGRGGSYSKIAPIVPSGKITNIRLDGSAEQAIRIVLTKEGGFSNHSRDTGGATIYGIASKHNPVEYRQIMDALQNNDQEAAKRIVFDTYKRKYWDTLGLDDSKMSPEAKLVAFDASVNQGVGYTRGLIAKTGGDVDQMLQERMNRYYAIVDKNNSQAVFLKGWSNRIAGINGIVDGSERLRSLGEYAGIDSPTNIKQGAVIAFGDSHANAMVHGSFAKDGQNLAGLRTTILSNIDTLPRGATVVASMGSNDVMGSMSPEAYARSYIKLLKELKDRGNNVVVVGIPELERSYNGASPAEWNSRAERLNDAIRNEAARNGMSYVDMEGTSTDGLHRTQKGYKATLQNAVYTTVKKPDLENDNPVRVASNTINPARDVSVGRARPAEELGLVDRATNWVKQNMPRFDFT